MNRKWAFVFVLLVAFAPAAWAQNDFKVYNDYAQGLSCYREASGLGMEISKCFMEGDIERVRELTARRDGLLLQSIDSVMCFRPDAGRSEAAARVVCGLAFNLGYDDTRRVAGRFPADFQPQCLQELREGLERESRVRPGQAAPDFELFDREGNVFTLESFRGRYIFLEFSASWCSWCKKEIPSILSAYERFNGDVAFITVNLDDDRRKWIDDLDQHPAPWYHLTDLRGWNSPAAAAYNVAGVPSCYVIDPEGVIRAKDLRRDEIARTLGELVAERDGIRFFEGSFADALEKARNQGRLVFMDCYTSWCAPCKMMNTTVFRERAVGEFFNANFVNVKFDMERGEGLELSRRYGMRVFPTYLVLDAEGNELHRVVGGHDAAEFIDLISEGMDEDSSIAGMQRRYDQGERDPDFLRRYIETLGHGYCFDRIPEVLDELCRRCEDGPGAEDWELMRRYLSEPDSYAFRFAAAHRNDLMRYAGPGEVGKWIHHVLYVPIFNTVNEAVFDPERHNGERVANLHRAVKDARPERAAFLTAILDFYDAYYKGRIGKALSIYRKEFLGLPGEERFGLTMILNAMLYNKGNVKECEEGLRIFRDIFDPADPIFQNFERSLNGRIAALKG